MKVVLLAGGFGTRISEESHLTPKPMIEIGGKPILWHIMKIYSHYGLNDFIVCCGYKGYVIKEFFSNYFLHNSDVTFDLTKNTMKIHNTVSEPWTVTLVDTGENTMTGGRLKRVAPFIDGENFCMTYGDGLADIDIAAEIKFHLAHGKLATLAATQPPGRFGVLKITDQTKVNSFQEKPTGDGNWINGGFFVLNKKVISYLDGDQTVWEKEPLEKLAQDNQLQAFFHDGFWQPMDTLRDKNQLESLWQTGNASWRKW